MTVIDRVQVNLLTNPFAGTNRGIHEPIETWVRRAEIACYACGGRNIGGVVEPIGWLCQSCIQRHRMEQVA